MALLIRSYHDILQFLPISYYDINGRSTRVTTIIPLILANARYIEPSTCKVCDVKIFWTNAKLESQTKWKLHRSKLRREGFVQLKNDSFSSCALGCFYSGNNRTCPKSGKTGAVKFIYSMD